jgi:hypothetical protein
MKNSLGYSDAYKFYLFFCFQSGQRLLNVEGHTGAVNDIQPYHDTTMFVTASKDTTAKVGTYPA